MLVTRVPFNQWRVSEGRRGDDSSEKPDANVHVMKPSKRGTLTDRVAVRNARRSCRYGRCEELQACSSDQGAWYSPASKGRERMRGAALTVGMETQPAAPMRLAGRIL